MLQLIPGVSSLLGNLFIPENPRYLAEKGQWEKAEEAISWLRGVVKEDYRVEQEMEEIQATIQATTRAQRLHPESWWKQLLKKGIRNRLGVGIGIMAAQNMSGLNALNYCEFCTNAANINASTDLMLYSFTLHVCLCRLPIRLLVTASHRHLRSCQTRLSSLVHVLLH